MPKKCTNPNCGKEYDEKRLKRSMGEDFLTRRCCSAKCYTEKAMAKGETTEQVDWRVHTPNLLQEIGNNETCNMLARPLQIFGRILHEVGERAGKLNDPILNELMCRLTVYAIADPESPHYDREAVELIEQKAKEYRDGSSSKETD